MRIVIIGPAHPLRGGIADTDESLCRALQELGHETTLVSYSRQYPDLLFPGRTQFSTSAAPEDLDIRSILHSYWPPNWWSTARTIAQMQPDLVIFRYWMPFMASCLGVIARRLKGRCRRVGMVDNAVPHERRMMDAPLTRYFTRSMDDFLVLSAAVEQDLRAFTDRPILTHAHPINDGLGEPKAKAAARDALGLDPEARYMLFFGLVRRYKGLDLLLHALAEDRLAGMHGLKLIVAGEFYDDISIYHDIIAEKGLGDRVELRDSFVAAEDLADLFSACDLVTQTYRSATQSGVTQMATHFERPILVTDVGGLAEVVDDGRSGYVSGLAPKDIAEAIARHFETADEAAMVSHIRQKKKSMSWPQLAKALLQTD